MVNFPLNRVLAKGTPMPDSSKTCPTCKGKSEWEEMDMYGNLSYDYCPTCRGTGTQPSVQQSRETLESEPKEAKPAEHSQHKRHWERECLRCWQEVTNQTSEATALCTCGQPTYHENDCAKTTALSDHQDKHRCENCGNRTETWQSGTRTYQHCDFCGLDQNSIKRGDSDVNQDIQAFARTLLSILCAYSDIDEAELGEDKFAGHHNVDVAIGEVLDALQEYGWLRSHDDLPTTSGRDTDSMPSSPQSTSGSDIDDLLHGAFVGLYMRNENGEFVPMEDKYSVLYNHFKKEIEQLISHHSKEARIDELKLYKKHGAPYETKYINLRINKLKGELSE